MAIPFAPTPFEIRELTGRQRMLSLTGRAAPFRPLKFAGVQRAEVTWYPGSEEGSAQMLGPKEEPTICNGKWDDYFLNDEADGTMARLLVGTDAGANGLVEDAFELVRIVDSIRADGQLVQVSWDEHVRIGLLQRFEHTWHDRTKVEWQMEFEWVSRGTEPGAPKTFTKVTTLDTLSKTMRAQFPSVASPWSPFIYEDPTLAARAMQIANRIGAYVDDVQNTINEAEDTATTVVDGLVAPVQATRRGVALMAELVDRTKALVAQSESVVVESFFGVAEESLDLVSGVTEAIAGATHLTSVCPLLALSKNMRFASQQARAMRNSAARGEAELIKTIQPETIAIYAAQGGENLREVSTRYYGTPDEWKFLMAYNGLKSSVLDAGQVIYVPQETQRLLQV